VHHNANKRHKRHTIFSIMARAHLYIRYRQILVFTLLSAALHTLFGPLPLRMYK